MGASHTSGPLIIAGADGSGTEFSQSPGPSVIKHGIGIMDARFNQQYGGDLPTYCWFGLGRIPVLNVVPQAQQTNNIAAAQAQVAGTPLNLVTVTGAGITAGVTVKNALTGTLATPVLAVEGAFGTTNLGGSLPLVLMYDPTKATARNVRISSVGNDSGGSFTVRGFDLYGFPLTETITGSNASVASGKKAFKYIQSVTPNTGVSASNVSVGTGDVFGFPLRVDFWPNVELYAANTFITANTGFLPAVTTDPSTPILGDTRGTYAVQTPSDGVRRIQAFITPDSSLLLNTGLFGIQNV